jgi:hypothetical protein
MNFNVYLDEKLGKEFTHYCKSAHKKKNAVVREALEAYIHHNVSTPWPEAILKFKGYPDIEPFENSRSEFTANKRPDFLGGDD